MALPERNYYDIEDLAARWNISLKDVRHYIADEWLVAQVWVEKQIVKTYAQKKTRDGEDAFVERDPKIYTGYAVLNPEVLRSVFKNGSAPANKFRGTTNEVFYKVIRPEDAPIIAIKDIMVHRAEMYRFEQEHQIVPAYRFCEPAPQKTISFPGRPSVMHRILAELARRQESGLVERSLKKEAEALVVWAQNILGHDAQVPRLKSVQNAIRDAYRDHLYVQHGITESDKLHISQ